MAVQEIVVDGRSGQKVLRTRESAGKEMNGLAHRDGVQSTIPFRRHMWPARRRVQRSNSTVEAAGAGALLVAVLLARCYKTCSPPFFALPLPRPIPPHLSLSHPSSPSELHTLSIPPPSADLDRRHDDWRSCCACSFSRCLHKCTRAPPRRAPPSPQCNRQGRDLRSQKYILQACG